MGQVALGLRSLFIRIAVFVVMAALLAWALGGTLWPRPVSAIQRPVVDVSGSQWGWEVTVDSTSREVSYRLVRRHHGVWDPVEGGGPFPSVEPLNLQSLPLGEGVIMRAVAFPEGAHPLELRVGSNGKATASPLTR
ncbi:MAG: hypothetical protein MK100_08720 [Phycisphaerales bacterium]|nr:hypothetical protein [Phycisphaerales bacterium]